MSSLQLAVVGGGPAGLRAAEVAASLGAKVTLFDAKPSVGRKFLVAGKGGMNLTHDEPLSSFATRYRSEGDPAEAPGVGTLSRWTSLLSDFGPTELREWAAELGVETFAASTGRVYPREMKSAPLLRLWVARMRASGVEFLMRHRLSSLEVGPAFSLGFEADGAPCRFNADAVILALGGASWPGTGSTGDWLDLLHGLGVQMRPLQPANCGWEVEWPVEMQSLLEGKPLKNLAASAGGVSARGELLVTRYGLEGGILYALSHALREMGCPVLSVDFKPESSEVSLVGRLGSARRNYLEEGGVRWRLGETALRLLQYFRGGKPFASGEEAAHFVKNCPIPLLGPRPVEEAISTAGGVGFEQLDEALMVRQVPGVFVAGEMLDWEAPTGGYLMQGCFASGTRAGMGAFRYLASRRQ